MKQDTANSTNGHADVHENLRKDSSKGSTGNKTDETKEENDGLKKTSRSAKEKKGTSPLEKFFLDMLKDIYYAEQQLVKAIPKMEKAATTEELKESFSDHLHQTEKHVKRLEKVFSALGKKAEGKKCEAIEGLIKEADTIINETESGTMTRDVALIVAAQKVEHYEIATYGSLVQLALTMDLNDVCDILDTTLMEEEETDRMLTHIAENNINIQAEQEGFEYSWQEHETTA